MAVDPRILQMISNPTGGKLGEIGTNYVNTRQIAIENKRNAEADAQAKTTFDQAQAITGAKVMGTYAQEALDWYDANPDASAEEARDFQVETMQRYDPSHQQFIPEQLQSKEALQMGLERSDMILRKFEPENYVVDENELNKWQTELAMITKKNSDPEGWTKTDQEQLDALSRQQNISINMRGPSKTEDVFALSSLDVLEKDGDKLSNNIENQQAYAQDLAATKRKLMEEREMAVKAGKETELLSDAEAINMAHDELKQHLQSSDVLFEMTGFTNPLGKKYIYAPNKTEVPTEDTEEAEIMGNPSDLKEGESGKFGGFMFKRENGKLLKKKVE